MTRSQGRKNVRKIVVMLRRGAADSLACLRLQASLNIDSVLSLDRLMGGCKHERKIGEFRIVSRTEDRMFEQLFETFRRASESSSQTQQELYRQWLQQLPNSPLNVAGLSADQAVAFQKKLAEAVTEALNRHRESLHAIYGSGIQVIERIFRVAEAKTPDDYRHLLEEVWRKLADTFREQSESQFHEFQKGMETWLDVAQKAQS